MRTPHRLKGPTYSPVYNTRGRPPGVGAMLGHAGPTSHQRRAGVSVFAGISTVWTCLPAHTLLFCLSSKCPSLPCQKQSGATVIHVGRLTLHSPSGVGVSLPAVYTAPVLAVSTPHFLQALYPYIVSLTI